MHRLLNGLHRHQVGLYTGLSFKEGGVHPLEPAWTSQVSIVVGDSITKEKLFLIISLKRRITPCIRFRTCMALRSNRATLITLVDSIYADIHKPRLPYSFYFLDHFIIIGVCFGTNYHDFIGQTTWSGLWAKT
ncbi:DNA-directed RNA polymerases II, IV and V subunit 3-like [Pyrus ussuriensis x Pyrus communis]|uniref:DNA-directed RNA polymerases II, IV and V subunit 3-like n=1 Tax=Pyrus ussuriensis x Pyrus communis TaxID=2448454 RepID=A0A5N5HGF8_9ROSA|nr:DNA-directed RNA polymerases II, IV and V subunit 3-like [Pyrus ussuriensis x Pyrus communis]